MARPAATTHPRRATLDAAALAARRELGAAQRQHARALAAVKEARARRASAARTGRSAGLTWPEIGERLGGVSEVQAIRIGRGSE